MESKRDEERNRKEEVETRVFQRFPERGSRRVEAGWG